MAMGVALSTGGRGAHGDFTGVGGPGGLATKVGLSDAPFNIRPVLPPNPLAFIVGETELCVGAGDFGITVSMPLASVTAGIGEGSRIGAGSSVVGRVIVVPSVHSIVSGAQSSSSSSMSAQVVCLPGSSD
jgi:hypothetical protein